MTSFGTDNDYLIYSKMIYVISIRLLKKSMNIRIYILWDGI